MATKILPGAAAIGDAADSLLRNQVYGGAYPNTGPQIPGGLRPNTGPQIPGGMGANAGPQIPGSMGPNAGPLRGMGANAGPQIPGGMGANAGPQIPGGMGPNAGPQAGVQPAAAAPAVPPEAKSGGWFKRTAAAAGNGAAVAGRVAKDVSTAALPGMAGYGAATAINSLRQKELDSAPAFVAPETQPGQIPGAAPGQVAPRAEAGSFLNQSELGRNLGNAIMALPGGSGAVGAIQSGLRIAPVVGRAAQAASVASKAAPIVPAVAQGFAGGDIANPGKSALPPTAPPTPPVAPFSDARQGPVVPTPKFVQKDGTILRDGNSYSGKNVQVDADIVNKDGSLRTPGGGFLSTGSSEGFRQDQLELQRNAAERAAMPTGGATDMGGRTTMMDDLVAKSKAGGPDLSKLPAGRRARLEVGLRQAQDANANARTIAGMNNATAQAGLANSAQIAAMHDATQRRSNDQNNATSLRGQDLSLAGHMAPLQLAAMQRDMHAKAYGAVGAGGKDGSEPVSVEQHLAAAKLLHAQGMPEQAAKAEAAAQAMTTLRGNQDAQSAARVKDTAEVFKPMFTTKDKDGNDKFDEVGAAKAAATVRGLYGDKYDMLSPDQKRAAFTDVVAKQKNADAEKQVLPGFIDRAKDLVGMYEKPPEVTGQRDLRGGVIERAGLISPPGVTRNSKLVRLPNGQTINYGEVNDAQFRDLEERTQLRSNPR